MTNTAASNNWTSLRHIAGPPWPASLSPTVDTRLTANVTDADPAALLANVERLRVVERVPSENYCKHQGRDPVACASDRTVGLLAQQVGASTSEGQRYAKRISYLVGPDTKVIAAYGTVRPSEHAGEVLADLAGK